MPPWRIVCGLSVLVATAGPARATLIGDSVEVRHLFPDSATVLASDAVTVLDGTSEIACTGNKTGPHNLCTFSTPQGENNSAWNINIEESSLFLTWLLQNPRNSRPLKSPGDQTLAVWLFWSLGR